MVGDGKFSTSLSFFYRDVSKYLGEFKKQGFSIILFRGR